MKKNEPKRIVALVTPESSTGREMLAGVLSAIGDEPNCQMTILDEPRKLTPAAVERLVRDRPTGFILSLDPGIKTLDALMRHNAPAVFVNVRDVKDERTNVRYVWNDNSAIGRMAAQHLLRQGFKNFAFAGIRDADWSQGRRHGFRAALPKSAPFAETVYSTTPNAAERAALAEWLSALAKPVAVFASCDFLAQDVVAAARAVRCTVPAHVAVIGVDDDSHNITTVMPGYRTMGLAAGKTLLTLLHGRRCPTDPVDVEPRRIIVRASTKVRKPHSDLVKDVQSHIRLHFAEDLDVGGLADYFGVSRSTLEHRLRDATDKSVREAIEDERLRAVCKLLKSGKLTLPEIAARCGFSSATRLSHLFRQRFNAAPVAWGKSQSGKRDQ